MEKFKRIAIELLKNTGTTAKNIFAAASSFIKNPGNQKYVLPAAVGLAVLLLIVLGVSIFRKPGSSQGASSKIQIAPPKATIELNKEFLFPLRDAKGVEVSKLKYTIESAQLTDELVVKGQIARSVRGRTFFILNIKVVNDYDKEIQIQTADYVRLSVNGNKSDWQAADAHNDPVAVAAASTKIVKIGFAINDTDRDLLLRIGEIKGDKTELTVKFK